MRDSLVPRNCTECGAPVLQHTSGYWVNQQNVPYCDAATQRLHYPSNMQQEPSRSGIKAWSAKKKGWVTVGALGLVAILAAAVLIVTTSGSASSQAIEPEARFTNNFHPEPLPSDPSTPVPCDPHLDQKQHCFSPKLVQGKGFMDEIKDTQGWGWLREHSAGWKCFKRGDMDLIGDDVMLAAKCSGADMNKSGEKPHTTSFSIGYQTNTHDPVGRVSEIVVYASTSAHTSKGQDTDVQDLGELAPHVIAEVLRTIWPKNEQARRGATQAFQLVQHDCANNGDNTVQSFMNNNYVVACGYTSPIHLDDEQGEYIHISSTFTIKPSESLGK